MDKNLFERVKKRIESYEEQMIELQRILVATPAIDPSSGGKGEFERAKILEPLLRNIFDEVDMYKAPDTNVACGFRPNLVARMRGKSAERTIWVMSHIDVVPAGDESKWNSKPFELTIKDGKLIGRGVKDNHLGIVASIFAAKALKEEGVRPTHDFGAIFVAEEETGSKYGARYLLEKHADIFKKGDQVLIPDWGNDKGSLVEVAEKSILWIKVKTLGKQCHAAYDTGINAHNAAAHLICKMEELYKKYPQRDDFFDPPRSTFEATKKEANVPNVNTIPGEDITYFDCRLLPSINVDEFLTTIKGYYEEIEKKCSVKIEQELVFRSDAAKATSVESPIFNLVKNTAKELLNMDVKPIGLGGQTVGIWFRNKGFDVAIYEKAPEVDHEPNEYLPIEDMVTNVKIVAHVILQ